jgi:HD-GYP domain-containing protein (c-di-GMP phosphodiesterase class II)
MRLAVRTFLWVFVPLTVLLTGSFWAVQRSAVTVVQNALRSSLRDHQQAVARMQERNEQQNRRYLRILGENASLIAGLQLILGEPSSIDARLTVEDQLRELCSTSGIDVLVVSSVNGIPFAGVLRQGGGLMAIDIAAVRPPKRGFFLYEGALYRMTSVPISQNEEHVALVSVGEREDFSHFSNPVVLLRDGEVIDWTVPGAGREDLQHAFSGCNHDADCELKLAGDTYLSIAAKTVGAGHTYTLRSLVNLDAALTPVQSVLRSVFLMTGTGAMLAAVVITILSSLSVARPIRRLVSHLHESERTGTLADFDARHMGAWEIRELAESFNRAAHSIREGKKNLQRAYVEFVGSLASALDARDPYTAGHSSRVCEFSCAIARRMEFDPDELDRLRIGALLHDIGKIGIPDAILRKPGRLTDEEFDLIKKHPEIGRRILEGVNGFAPYLGIVELHHENWDGSGYPHGLRGGEVPLSARIVHVADAYDAMTSDRPYRPGMHCDVAIRILKEHAGGQFDPDVVEVFAMLLRTGLVDGAHNTSDEGSEQSLRKLAAALTETEAASPSEVAGRSRA